MLFTWWVGITMLMQYFTYLCPPQSVGVQGSDKEMELFVESAQRCQAVFPVTICEACNAAKNYNELCPVCDEHSTKVKYLQM